MSDAHSRADYDLLMVEFEGLRARVVALEASDVDIRRVMQAQEANSAELRRLQARQQEELKGLREKQAQVDVLLSRFADHLTGVIEP